MAPASLAGQLDDELPKLTWSESASALLNGSPQLTERMAGVERAQCAVAQACAQRTPNVEVLAAVRYNDNSNSTNASLMVGVPLMIHNRNQGNILKAQAELAAAQHEVKRLELLLQEQLAAAFRDYEIAREQVGQYQQGILPERETVAGTGPDRLSTRGVWVPATLDRPADLLATNLAYIERFRELRLRPRHPGHAAYRRPSGSWTVTKEAPAVFVTHWLWVLPLGVCVLRMHGPHAVHAIPAQQSLAIDPQSFAQGIRIAAVGLYRRPAQRLHYQ